MRPVRVSTIILSFLALLCPGSGLATGPQGRHPARLDRAEKRISKDLRDRFRQRGLSWPPRRAFIRILKRERRLELWAAGRRGPYGLVRRYPICAASGTLGPKRRQGDLQVPEGFYHVSSYNPWSAYHLSLGINYPNALDRRVGHRANLGGAILIHGDCVSVGCVAITNPLIEEVYLVAEAAARAGWRVPVHIFPTSLDGPGMAQLALWYASRPDLLSFWRTLEPAYRHFEMTHELPTVTVAREGYRMLAPPRVAFTPSPP